MNFRVLLSGALLVVALAQPGWTTESASPGLPLAATDPAIQAGRLQIEIHPWLTQRGNILDPEFPAASAGRAP